MEDYDDYSELYGEPSELMPNGELELRDLAEPGAELSTGLALIWRRQFVFAIEPRAAALGNRGDAGAVAFVGIGGHLEPGEGWEEAVIREAYEEANCPIAIGDAAVTYLCRADSRPKPLRYRWREPHRPLLMWTATFDLHRGPDAAPTSVTLINAVFRAAALARPSPGAEIAALLVMDPDLLLQTYAAPRPFAELSARGAQLIGDPLAPGALLAPGGSAFFLAQWLAWQERET